MSTLTSLGFILAAHVTSANAASLRATAPLPLASEGGVQQEKLTLEAQLPVWVHAFARSGSSTILSMVSNADTSQGVFSLFEPCHKGDKLESDLKMRGCGGLLSALAVCDFSQIESLHGWTDVHSLTGVSEYSPTEASNSCSKKDLVTFKTVSMPYQPYMSDFERVLADDKRMKVIAVVRDPRSIYSSWFTTWPFSQEYTRDIKAMKIICDGIASTLRVDNPRVHHVVFERLVQDPQAVMQEAYSFLGKKFGDKQADWIKRTFNAHDCPGVDQYIAPYSDCHTNATESLEKWRNTLTMDELTFFNEYEPCQKVRTAMNYPA